MPKKLTALEMDFNKPVPSWRRGKKYAVKVRDTTRPKGYKVIHFGNDDYEDYTQHRDRQRRDSYIARASGIVDGNGHRTINNPKSANYWAARYLWGYK